MNEIKHEHGHNRATDRHGDHPRRPYWRRAHHDWKFWVALLLMLVAILAFVISNNLSRRPGHPPQAPLSSPGGA
jgi:hypothetical protein